MESLSFHNTSRTLLSVTAEHLKKTPLAFSIALQPLKCLHGQYGKVHAEIAFLSCFPSCNRYVLQALVWVSHRPLLLWFRGPAQHLWGWVGGGRSLVWLFYSVVPTSVVLPVPCCRCLLGLVIRAHANDFVSKSNGKPTALT